tara:strand:- start:677 stop:1138 length:462 start_codon:yes stop_codon:yes gene_type:complete
MKKILLIASFSMVLLMFSCKKKEATDEEKPTINSVLLNETEMLTELESEVFNGDKLFFTISLSDNIALSELSVEVHEAGNGHDHERIQKTDSIPLSPLAFGPKIYDLGGEQVKVITVEVSDSLANEVTDYHLELIVLDKESNRTTTIQAFEIK